MNGNWLKEMVAEYNLRTSQNAAADCGFIYSDTFYFFGIDRHIPGSRLGF